MSGSYDVSRPGCASAPAPPRAGCDLTALDQAIGDGDHGTNMDRGFTASSRSSTGTGPTATATDAGRGRPPPAGQDPDQHGRRRLRAALWHRIPASVGGVGARPTRRPAAACWSPPWRQRSAGSGARQGHDRREDDARCARPGRGGRPRRARRRAATRGGHWPLADAAEAGAAATIPMLATKGRASYLGERCIGHQDPGRDVVGAAPRVPSPRRAAGSGPAAATADLAMAQAILVGRAGSPGVGIGPAAARSGRRPDRDACRRRSGGHAGDGAATGSRVALGTRGGRARALAASWPSGRARRSARSSRRRPCSRATRASSIPRCAVIDDGLAADEAILRAARTSRRTRSRPSTTSTSASARRTCATWAGGSPPTCRPRATASCHRAMAIRPSSLPTISTHRPWPRSGRSWSAGSPSRAGRPPGTRRSSLARSGSRSCSAWVRPSTPRLAAPTAAVDGSTGRS